jgi:hypothetical protein
MSANHWRVSVLDLVWMVNDDYLGQEGLNFFGRIIDRASAYIAALDVLHYYVFDVEANVVSRDCLRNVFVVFVNRLNF